MTPILSNSRPPNCSGCIFKTQTCGTRGPRNSPFVVVGESPGKNEVKAGMPFVGDSGKMINTVIADACKALDVPFIEPFFTNAVACFPANKDQRKLQQACASCHSRLDMELKAHSRKVILALGGPAAWTTTGDYSIKITQVRGTQIASPYAEYGIILSVHPAFLLRGGGSFPKFKEDIKQALRHLHNLHVSRYVMSTHTVFQHGDEIADYHNLLLREQPEVVGADIETSGFSPIDDDILCNGLAHTFEHAYIVPEELIHSQEHKALLEDRRLRFLWHNGKFDVRFLRTKGIDARVDEDLMLASYVLDETRGMHDLEQVSGDAVGAPNWKAMLTSYLPNKKASYRLIPRPVLHKYNGFDVSAMMQSLPVLKERINNDPLHRQLYPWLVEKSNFLVEIEREGLLVDRNQNREMFERFTKEIQERKDKLNVVALARMGKHINPNAPHQVAELLYDAIKLPKIRGSRSTDADHLDMLPPNPVVRMVKDYRRSAKIYSTYVKSLYNREENPQGVPGENVHSDGKVHSSFLLHGSVTGRLASRDPNIQNIPRESDIRSQFIAPPDRKFVELDLNQAELRCLAELSRCDDLSAIYLDPNHPGLHHEMSIFLFGEGYTDEDKMKTKTVNFGIVYGRTGPSLAEEWKVSVAEGNRWVDGWFKRFPGAARFINSCRQAPLEGKVLITPFGRKRRFGVVSYENKGNVQNEASNFPHQSIASDCNMEAAHRVFSTFAKDYDARPCNLVHDSNLWNLPDDEPLIQEFGHRVIDVMQQVPKDYGLTYIPFVADGKVGYRWGHLSKVKNDYWKVRANRSSAEQMVA